MTDKISVLVYTRNESNNITDCLASARLLTDSLIVIDMESTDDTAAIAKKQGAQVFSFPYKRYVEPARKFGVSKANTGWVFILDADERITAELAAEIIKTINSPTSYNRPASPAGGQPITFFQVPRKNIFGHKKWLKYGGWWPDYQTRLIDKRHFRDWPNQIHSTPVIQGAQGCLTNPLLHYFHGNLQEMVNKTINFENIESDLLFQADKPVGKLTFFRKFLGELWRRLFKLQGYRDGAIGIIESIYQAYSKTITYLYLYEKKKNRPLRPVS